MTSVPKPAPKKPKPRKRVKVSNPKRRKSEFARTYHSKERVAWVKSQPCVVCPMPVPSENAHIENGGLRRKAGYEKIVPLCPAAHRLLDSGAGRAFFELLFEVSLEELAAETERRWLARDK